MITRKQRQFINSFEGKCKGQYHITYLASIRVLGGNDLRMEAQDKYGRPLYRIDEMYPTREASLMVLHAVEKGVSPERLNKNVAKTYEREQPDMFKGLTADNTIDIIMKGFSDETDYVSSLTILERVTGRVVMERSNSPMPCDYFKGLIGAFFEIVKVPGKNRGN